MQSPSYGLANITAGLACKSYLPLSESSSCLKHIIEDLILCCSATNHLRNIHGAHVYVYVYSSTILIIIILIRVIIIIIIIIIMVIIIIIIIIVIIRAGRARKSEGWPVQMTLPSGRLMAVIIR